MLPAALSIIEKTAVRAACTGDSVFSAINRYIRERWDSICSSAAVQDVIVIQFDHEEIIKIKNLSSDGKIPRGLLIEGGEAIKDGSNNF